MEERCDLDQSEDVDLNRSLGLHLTVMPPQNDELDVSVVEDLRETGGGADLCMHTPPHLHGVDSNGNPLPHRTTAKPHVERDDGDGASLNGHPPN